jgi:hypothetical protein
MENKFQTSFIPKKSLDDSGRVKVKTPRNVLSLVSTMIITLTILAAAGVFGYSYLLDRRIVSAQQILEEKERNFDYNAVNEIVRVDNKLKAATTLLDRHTAVSGVFGFLEESTLKNLRFTSFDFAYLSPTRISINMKGQARSFGAVARQAELFASSTQKEYFKDPIFSDLNLDERGNIIFSFLTSVDPTLIDYANNLPVPGTLRAAPVTPVRATTTSSLNPNDPYSTSTNFLIPR